MRAEALIGLGESEEEAMSLLTYVLIIMIITIEL
jgi:hypothetical protein